MERTEKTVATIDNLFGTHLTNLQNAMDRTTRRHGQLANNLANVNTPGFKRKDSDFNIILADEMNPSKEHLQSLRESQAQAASDRTSVRQDGNNVNLESEVMHMAETELRYQTLTDITANYFSGLKNVIREGK
jgi:flagellar basal-body rod protein FlgB